MLSPSPRNPLAYLYSRKQDEGYNQQAGEHPLAHFPSTPDGNHAALYTLPVARGHGQRNRDLVGFSDKWISMSTSDNTAMRSSRDPLVSRYRFRACGRQTAPYSPAPDSDHVPWTRKRLNHRT